MRYFHTRVSRSRVVCQNNCRRLWSLLARTFARSSAQPCILKRFCLSLFALNYAGFATVSLHAYVRMYVIRGR